MCRHAPGISMVSTSLSSCSSIADVIFIASRDIVKDPHINFWCMYVVSFHWHMFVLLLYCPFSVWFTWNMINCLYFLSFIVYLHQLVQIYQYHEAVLVIWIFPFQLFSKISPARLSIILLLHNQPQNLLNHVTFHQYDAPLSSKFRNVVPFLKRFLMRCVDDILLMGED